MDRLLAFDPVGPWRVRRQLPQVPLGLVDGLVLELAADAAAEAPRPCQFLCHALDRAVRAHDDVTERVVLAPLDPGEVDLGIDRRQRGDRPGDVDIGISELFQRITAMPRDAPASAAAVRKAASSSAAVSAASAAA